MKTTTTKKLNEALVNAEKFIKEMEQMDDKKLSKHITIFQQQMQKAYEQNNQEAYQLLAEYEWQTIQARVNKM